MSEQKLTEKQALFVAEYLVDLNATKAAIRAGYSEHTANVIGSENLAKPYIAAAIALEAQKRIVSAQISAERVLCGLYEEATREGEGSSHGARVTAWTRLGQYHRLFIEKVEHSGPEGGPIQVEEKSSPRSMAREIAFALAAGLHTAKDNEEEPE